jgi:pyrimidine operon attenuation protein/uracil phosphoribosyltransferase
MQNGTLILTDEQVRRKIRRMAYEIYENNYTEKEIVLAGILDQGCELAKLLAAELEDISPLKTILVGISLDKAKPTQSSIELDLDEKSLKNRSVVLVDDVLNTGRTLAYSLKPFLKVKIKRLEVAVLVNRSHAQFPVSARYCGYDLSTTINEHVLVSLSQKKLEVFLQ